MIASSHFKKSNWTLVFLLAFYEMAIYLSNDAYLPAFPRLSSELHTTPSLVQLTIAAWLIGSGLLYLVTGLIADRIGRRTTLLFGGILFIASTIGCALSHEIYSLMIWRFIQGAAIPSMVVPAYATIHDLFDRENAIHISAIMGSISI